MKFLTKESTSPKDVHERVVAMYRESKPLYSKLNIGTNSSNGAGIHYEPKSGISLVAGIEEIINKVKNSVLTDLRVKFKILHDNLGLNKESLCWISRRLSPEIKLCKLQI